MNITKSELANTCMAVLNELSEEPWIDFRPQYLEMDKYWDMDLLEVAFRIVNHMTSIEVKLMAVSCLNAFGG